MITDKAWAIASHRSGLLRTEPSYTVSALREPAAIAERAKTSLEHLCFYAPARLLIEGAARAARVRLAIDDIIGIGGTPAALVAVGRGVGRRSELFECQHHVPLTSIRSQ